MTEVLEHLVDPDKALDEVLRVLTPRGHLVLSTPNLACLPNRLLMVLGIQPLFSEVSTTRVLGRRFSVFGQGGQPVGHLRLYTKLALTEFLQAHGFSMVRIRGAAFHAQGLLSAVERVIAFAPSFAMILVVSAQVKKTSNP
jgi:SAM-dependent methyltransferase